MIRISDLTEQPPFAMEDVAFCSCAFRLDASATASALPDLPASLERAVPKRQAEFLAGRLCAERAVGRMGGASGPIAILPDRRPNWPDGLVGSITHSSGYAVAAVARAAHYAGLGLDRESIISPERAHKIRDMIVSPSERSCADGSLSFEAFVTLVFSAKETLYKAIYPLLRTFMDFHSAEAVAYDRDRITLRGRSDAFTRLKGIVRSRDFHVRYLLRDGAILTFLEIPRL